MTDDAVSSLQDLWQKRALYYGEDHALMDDMISIYAGELPADFDDYFHEDMHVHVPNMIRLAWDDLTAMAGKVFPIYVRPDNDSPTAKKRAEHLEMIGYWYNEAGARTGGIGGRQLMQVLSWWMIGCANAIAMALPNYDKKTPFFTFRDPRTFYPPVGWAPYTQAAPKDGLFAYQLSLGELKARYPRAHTELSNLNRFMSYPAIYGGMRGEDEDSTQVWVGEYYHQDSWVLATLTDRAVTLARTDSGDRMHPGVMPVVPMGLYSPSGAAGRSIFADQISIQAALARMFSQKLDYYDRTLYQLIFHTPVSGNTIKMGPYATNEYEVTSGIQPRVDAIGPAHPIDADQTMQFVIGLSRMLNRNPEQFQGGGDADSAKAITELKAGITSTVRDGLWPPMVAAMPKLYSAAAQMDLHLWKYVKRDAIGTRKNSDFKVSYLPATDLMGRQESFEVEPGLGLAGYQGTVEILQLLGAEAISEDTAQEQLEHTREPQAEKRRIFSDRIQKVIFSSLAAQAQQGTLAPGAMSEIRRRANAGEDPYDVIEEMEKTGRLTAPIPSPLGAGGPGGQGAVPINPNAALPIPNLSAIRAQRGGR